MASAASFAFTPLDAAARLTSAPGVAAALLGAAVSYLLFAPRGGPKARAARSEPASSTDGDGDELDLTGGALDLRRQAALVKGGATDHAEDVIVATAPGFDMDKTIFKTLDGALERMVMKYQVGVEFFWSDHAVARIATSASSIPKAPCHDQCILDFMRDDCDFRMEHADGSFVDHLRFCYEYSAIHYKQHSPRVLFLHSILGVGTNIFPMDKKHLPRLQSMLTPAEFAHIEAFPAFLRLLYHHNLIDELMRCDRAKLDTLRSITFHKVIDNGEMTLDAGAFWVQLNYQMIHLLDFIPAANWKANMNNTFFQVFLRLYNFLTLKGKLDCQLDFDLSRGFANPDERPLTLAGVISGATPSTLKMKIGRKAIARYSRAIGHDLDYSIAWA